MSGAAGTASATASSGGQPGGGQCTSSSAAATAAANTGLRLFVVCGRKVQVRSRQGDLGLARRWCCGRLPQRARPEKGGKNRLLRADGIVRNVAGRWQQQLASSQYEAWDAWRALLTLNFKTRLCCAQEPVLRQAFEAYGAVENFKVIRDKGGARFFVIILICDPLAGGD